MNDAISADPYNVQLHYTIGTIYIDLKENQKAEDALRKALELDPSNADIQYQLGAHLYNWATELKLERDKLSKGDFTSICITGNECHDDHCYYDNRTCRYGPERRKAID